jgi:hypothetical protein
MLEFHSLKVLTLLGGFKNQIRFFVGGGLLEFELGTLCLLRNQALPHQAPFAFQLFFQIGLHFWLGFSWVLDLPICASREAGIASIRDHANFFA